MSEKIEQLILRKLTITPGLVGIAPIDFDKPALSLQESQFIDGIKVEKNLGGIMLSIAIITKYSINMNVVATEINTAIKNILASAKVILKELKIYVRGVQ